MRRLGNPSRIVPLLAAFSLLLALPHSLRAENDSQAAVLEKLSESSEGNPDSIIDNKDLSFSQKITALAKTMTSKENQKIARDNLASLEKRMRKRNGGVLSPEAIDAIGKAYLELGNTWVAQGQAETNSAKRNALMANAKASLVEARGKTQSIAIKKLINANIRLTRFESGDHRLGANNIQANQQVQEHRPWGNLTDKHRAAVEQGFADCAKSATCRKAVEAFIENAKKTMESVERARTELGALMEEIAHISDGGFNGAATKTSKRRDGSWDFLIHSELFKDPNNIAPHLAQMMTYAQEKDEGWYSEYMAQFKGVMASVYTHYEVKKARFKERQAQTRQAEVNPSRFTQALNFLVYVWEGGINPTTVDESQMGPGTKMRTMFMGGTDGKVPPPDQVRRVWDENTPRKSRPKGNTDSDPKALREIHKNDKGMRNN